MEQHRQLSSARRRFTFETAARPAATIATAAAVNQPRCVPPKSTEIADLKDWCLARADEWYAQKEFGFARDFLQHALDLDPFDVEIWIALGSLHFTSNNLDAALFAFTQADELRPDDATLQLHLAVVQQHRRSWAHAETHFRNSLELQPENPGALKLYAGFLLARERFSEAREILERALMLDLDDVEFFMSLGVCYFRMENPQAARACFERALQLERIKEMARENLMIINSFPKREKNSVRSC
ncbi:MAG TPA: tetratricopeptide repeat protein [Verrucomicrobiae bacterium]